ncbi:MAG: UTP--glucose-1-phosphate uridylyltransferase [Verrucomicrobia bacterium]|nr:MAG: UTP--glucose-1-phosphate uridylyltransferase [Verrucomicrobiota bacterium]
MSKFIKHALITAAGGDERRLPLQNLTNKQGKWRPVIVIQLDEMFDAGIERVGVIIRPADRSAYEAVLAGYGQRVTLIEQSAPLGYGHAVLCGREFVGTNSFLLQVSDHLYIDAGSASCTKQLLELAAAEGCALSAVQPTPESQLCRYGTIAGALVPGRSDLFQIESVIEKPTPTVAEQVCVVPGLRLGHYLCFFGMHVLTPTVFSLLETARAAASSGKLGLSPVLSALAAREKYLAARLPGRRADLEARLGVFRAQLALGLNGPARSAILAVLAEELTLDASLQNQLLTKD